MGAMSFSLPPLAAQQWHRLVGRTGVLNVMGAYSTVTAWLNTGKISNASDGVMALSGTSNETINLSAYPLLNLAPGPPARPTAAR